VSARATRATWLPGLIALGLLAVALLALTSAGQPGGLGQSSSPSASDRQGALGTYEKLPLSFVPNAGQTDQRVRYYAQAPGRAFYFTKDKAVFSFAGK
jgi:hypothetical protein